MKISFINQPSNLLFFSQDSIEPKIFKFPAGECHVSFNECAEFRTLIETAAGVEVTQRIRSSDDLLQLVMATETIRHFNSSIPVHVTIPYAPASRQDRRNGFEGLGCKVYADIINAQNYNSVTIYDAHSDVIAALINNCRNISPIRFIRRAIADFKPDVIVAPDAGAAKKIGSYNLGLDIVYCSKFRNVNTGQLDGFQVHCDDWYERPLIVDDCLDGGGTFLGLAPVIKSKMSCEEIGLYITHGIFSKGVEIITNVFDDIYCTDSYRTDLVPTHKLTVFQI